MIIAAAALLQHELIFFFARTNLPAQAGVMELENLPMQAGCAFEQVRWVEPGSLPGFDFLPADAELVRQLSAGALRLPRAVI
jgi:hypothetical protein